ncbi:MAG TPA: 50S ribosomal protein L4 [Candidatus Baltobacteraceae bacterium]|jgi:large subunit ribosomal protein L4|nr:50S ribosomal protein L4 [Candidatus Baltobacteraceae bacterium]
MILIDAKGGKQRKVEVPAVFVADELELGGKRNAIFRAVFRELSNRRAGTASTLRRDEVSGGGRKPWKQKGTGRARQGSTRSPQWTHGGVVFGPKPRSYVISLNKKERRSAMLAALSDRFAGGFITVLDPEGFALAKTREMAVLLFGNDAKRPRSLRTLVVYAAGERDGIGAQIERISRNLSDVRVTHTGALDVKDVLGHARVVLTSQALEELTATFQEVR